MSGKSWVAAFLLLISAQAFCADKEPPMETLDIHEVVERSMSVDEKTFRLKFFYRQEINQIEADKYWVRVFDLDYNHIVVTFPKEALNYFKKITEEKDSYKKFRYNESYGTSAGSASSVYVTAQQITQQTAPPWFKQYYYNNKQAPWLILEAIGKSGSKNISGQTTYKW